MLSSSYCARICLPSCGHTFSCCSTYDSTIHSLLLWAAEAMIWSLILALALREYLTMDSLKETKLDRGDMLSRFADSLFFYALHHYLAMSPTHHCCSHTHVHRRRRALIRIVRACARQLECRGSVQLLVPWFRAIGFRTNLYDALTKTLLAPVVTAKNPYMCMHHSKHVHFVDQLDALDIHQHARIHHACDH